MLIGNANGDAELTNDKLKCFIGVQSFAGYFMLSLETQVSIGYGSRSLNDHCPEVVFLLCLQIILGVAICGLTVNIVYIKMTKSQNKYSKLFSKHAVVSNFFYLLYFSHHVSLIWTHYYLHGKLH